MSEEEEEVEEEEGETRRHVVKLIAKIHLFIAFNSIHHLPNPMFEQLAWSICRLREPLSRITIRITHTYYTLSIRYPSRDISQYGLRNVTLLICKSFLCVTLVATKRKFKA